MKRYLSLILIAAFLIQIFPVKVDGAVPVRIKDLTRLKGLRSNQLIGYGLVTGLDGSGDGTRAKFTLQSIANMLRRMGQRINVDEIRVDNTAAVLVTVTLPPYVREGDRLDAKISSLGDADNIQGGVLIQTPLMGGDGKVYAVAQGSVSIGGMNPKTGGSKQHRNHPLVGIVPNGIIVERDVTSELRFESGEITLLLNDPDFVTAARLTATINQSFSEQIARAVDPQAVTISIPAKYASDPVTFVATIENMEVEPDQPSRIVINERTGTIVMGENVRVSKVSVTHGNITVNVANPDKPGQTIRTDKHLEFNDAVTVSDVVKALNVMGASPRDTISILQAMKSTGAIYANVILM